MSLGFSRLCFAWRGHKAKAAEEKGSSEEEQGLTLARSSPVLYGRWDGI